ncbi:hypothetical protein GQ597_11355 [Gilliamella sp. Pra-s65]|uniref:hypothetical protein n=1 Tax=unclassified Gilliamella TaxID=2685620 RepID=UPI0013660DE0|nr:MULTISPECIES: hypothetical protein [unclassified Gilliamella]MWN91295.1 hypothetical protein [Gilliamella sp. Pra-s65]MWP74271.1 hypothetical protein [Gilliamella sp. Pra-s52]
MTARKRVLFHLPSFEGFFTELADRQGDKTMTSKKIIDQLQQLDWYVECKTEHELALV